MWKFVQSASDKSNWLTSPKALVAFIGRSNVGKSSLINALAKTTIARTSNTPGRTRLINYFIDENNNYYVDLPGYGYALMSKNDQQLMLEMIDEFLHQSSNLKTVVLLFDARRGLGDYEENILEWAKQEDKHLILVATKLDKLNQSEKHQLKQNLLNKQLENEVFFVSSTKKTNVNNLQQRLLAVFKS
ncbi:ribosome biogenesis GTP-binding protein YihA/YsxC [Mycoplasmopsis agassizii]|uniref:ribosome biogenesis GTP-binding protein YihA/YsxC n=1 Tax=Mycoplasmopsis agassizii TaxID=33922 RepID=UPI003529699E